MTVVKSKTMKEKDVGDNAKRVKERRTVLDKLKDNTSDDTEYHDQILETCELISSHSIASGAYEREKEDYSFY